MIAEVAHMQIVRRRSHARHLEVVDDFLSLRRICELLLVLRYPAIIQILVHRIFEYPLCLPMSPVFRSMKRLFMSPNQIPVAVNMYSSLGPLCALLFAP